MTETELRQYFVNTACSYLGCKEADGSHKKIIDLYNSISPLPVNYKVSYSDAWCAAYVSAIAQRCGITNIVFPECGCDRMIALYKKAGRWQENDGYKPQMGDILFYDWGDSGNGDNTGSSDHVGIIVSVSGLTIKVVEGNISDKVGYRNIVVDGRYIRGYGLPDFANAGEKVQSTPVTPNVQSTPVVTTTAKTVSITLSQLSRGVVSPQVKTMQLLLIGKGFSCGIDGADGDFGANTDAALRKFQKANGLTVDGICGANTWNKLIN